MSRSAPIELSLWKWPAEALLVGEGGDAHDHRVGELAGREERQRTGLAAQLVDRVVDVGQVLDLGDREQPHVRRALGHAEDRRLVQKRVEHARLAEARLQPARHAVHAALLADVLAEHERLGMADHLVRQGRAQVAGQGAQRVRGGVLGQLAAVGLRPRLAVDEGGGRGAAPLLVVGSQRRDDLGPRDQLGARRGLARRALHALAGGRDDRGQLVGGGRPLLDQAPGVARQRVLGLALLDLLEGAVGGLDVRAGVAPQPHATQVQEHRLVGRAARLQRQAAPRPRSRPSARAPRSSAGAAGSRRTRAPTAAESTPRCPGGCPRTGTGSASGCRAEPRSAPR